MGQAKKLYRNTYDKVIGGVASGLAEYFDVDVVIFRLLFVLLVLFGGGGLLAYIIMWIVVPAKPIPFRYNKSSGAQASSGTGGDAGGATPDAENTTADSENATSRAASAKNPSNTSLIAGIILILVGVLFLANRMLPWFEMRDFWPVLLIAGGFLIIDPNILKSKNRQQ